MTDNLVQRLRNETRDWISKSVDRMEAADRIETLAADFTRQVQRTDEQREAYEQALSVMEADNERLRDALFAWVDLMNDPNMKLHRKVVDFHNIAITALK